MTFKFLGVKPPETVTGLGAQASHFQGALLEAEQEVTWLVDVEKNGSKASWNKRFLRLVCLLRISAGE
jgi:hypothetical protein